MSAWKPGDVAMVNDTTGGPWRVAVCTGGGEVGSARWNYGKGNVWSSVSEARPLVVIDPEEIPTLSEFADSAAEALSLIADGVKEIGAGDLDATEEIIRWLASQMPPAPKPDEPQGLGAVVEAADGRRWVRCEPDGGIAKWLLSQAPEHTDPRFVWSAVPAVRVLSEGVTS